MNPYFYSLNSILAGEDEANEANEANEASTHDKVVCHGKFTHDDIEYLKLPVSIGHGCGRCAAENNHNLCLDMPDCGTNDLPSFIFLKWSE